MMGIITDSVMKQAEAVVPSNSVSRTGVGSRHVGILLFCANVMSINEWEDPESIRVTIFETSFDDKGIDNEFEEGITFSLTAHPRQYACARAGCSTPHTCWRGCPSVFRHGC